MSKLFGWLNKKKPEEKPQNDVPATEPADVPADITPDADAPVEPAVVELAAEPEVAESNDVPDVELVEEPTQTPAAVPEPVAAPAPAPEKPVEEKKSFFGRLKASLSRTKANLGSGIVSLFKGKTIDEDLYEELETQLLVADVGMDTTGKIIKQLTEQAKLSQLKDGDALYELLKGQLKQMLQNVDKPLPEVIAQHDSSEGPFVILMVGVNGVGKTTTIGKLAKQFQQDGKKVMLAAGDTFRAAAVEQLQVWGERNNIPVIAQPTGSDSASVLFDALQSAKARGIDILIADTAGRLQNKDNLMEELKKVVRVMKRINPSAPHEVMLTLDCLLYTSPSPRDRQKSRMPSSA